MHTKNSSFVFLAVLGLLTGIWSVHAQNYFYDVNNQLIRVVYEDGSAITYTNDAMGNVTAITTISAPPSTIAMPVIAPAGGTFTNTVSVTLTCVTTGVTLRYTTDGTDPIASSPAYTKAFAVTSSGTVKATAFKTGSTPSAVASATFTIISTTATVALPTITPPTGGTFTNSWKVTLGCATAGATIRYTTDGTEPTSQSTAYKKTGIIITNSVTIKAKAFKTKMADSTVATATFTIIVPPPPAIATTSLANAVVKQSYTAPLQVNPGTGWGANKWSLAPKSKLPAGLTLNAKTGIISGKPTKIGTFTFTVLVTDARKKSGNQPLTLTVN